MQQFEPSEDELQGAPPPPTGAELPELEHGSPVVELPQDLGPRRDVEGRTLDEALLADRGVREQKLRRARQVVSGMQFCNASRKFGERVVRGAWVPLAKFLYSIMPKSGEQLLLFLAGLCCFGVPLFYIGAMLVAVGVAGSILGLALWALATVTHAVLELYLRHLIPW